MSITCPSCGRFSPDGAVRCDCGFRFGIDKPIPAKLRRRAGGLGLTVAVFTGIACAAAVYSGALVAFIALGGPHGGGPVVLLVAAFVASPIVGWLVGRWAYRAWNPSR